MNERLRAEPRTPPCGLTPIVSISNPFSRPRTESQIRKDLAEQLTAMVRRWEDRILRDREGRR